MIIFITEGHYEDHADHLMEYVRDGGGLIIGGHAITWAANDADVIQRSKCSILEYPGNKIVARAGIAFSRMAIPAANSLHYIPGLSLPISLPRDDKLLEFNVEIIPALKYSLYYAVKACLFQPFSIFLEEIFSQILKQSDTEDIEQFSDQLAKQNEFFCIIFECIQEIKKNT